MPSFHKDGTLPGSNQIFVFGSNLKGLHSAGAALIAHNNFKFPWGVGRGWHGDAFAIPTKDRNIQTRSLKEIEFDIKTFKLITHKYIKENWFVTRIGCGLAGYDDKDIAPMFRNAINCSFAEEWRPWLE
jgi:hypothetical protein